MPSMHSYLSLHPVIGKVIVATRQQDMTIRGSAKNGIVGIVLPNLVKTVFN
jgi:hypothetical protein